jgi:hypothetical protein
MRSNRGVIVLTGTGIGLAVVIAVGWSLLVFPERQSKGLGLVTSDPKAFQGYTLLAPIFSTSIWTDGS